MDSILSIIYTIGHIIAGSVVYVLTGSYYMFGETVALVEPMLNGLWFFLLHKLWKRFA